MESHSRISLVVHFERLKQASLQCKPQVRQVNVITGLTLEKVFKNVTPLNSGIRYSVYYSRLQQASLLGKDLW
jgi:hypothetical protein